MIAVTLASCLRLAEGIDGKDNESPIIHELRASLKALVAIADAKEVKP
jgi:hypothetical protein